MAPEHAPLEIAAAAHAVTRPKVPRRVLCSHRLAWSGQTIAEACHGDGGGGGGGGARTIPSPCWTTKAERRVVLVGKPTDSAKTASSVILR